MANLTHGVTRTDALLSTSASTGLYSVKFYNGDSETDIDNGCVVKLDSLLPDEREVWKGVAPEADTPLNNIVLISSPEVMYDERLRNLSDFYNVAGTVARGYQLHAGDMFSVTNLDGTPAVGATVELQAGTAMKVVESATAGSTKVGTVVAVETVNSLTYAVIRVG